MIGDSAQQIADEIVKLLTTYGLDVVGAVVILIVGRIAAGWAERFVGRMLGRSKRVDQTLTAFFGNLVRYTVLIFTVLAVLAQFGVQTASLLAVFGAGALAIGLALQGTLSNVAAGVMLLIFRPFKSATTSMSRGNRAPSRRSACSSPSSRPPTTSRS